MIPRSMIRLGLAAGALALVAITPKNASAAKPAPQPTNINVTSTIQDQVGSTLHLFRSDLQGGTNTTTYTTTGGVTSTVGLAAGAGWSTTLFNQSARKVWITLNAVDGSAPPAPSGLYAQNVEIYSWCFDAAGNRVGYLSIPEGTSNNRCIFSFDFGSGRDKFKLAMGQFASPASGWATVTCHASQSSGACISWTIMPNTIDANANIANLYKFANGGLVLVGQYYNTFRIDVTYP
jgi:hypothetical protein